MGLSLTPPSGIALGGPLGTPSSGTLTNAVGYSISNSVTTIASGETLILSNTAFANNCVTGIVAKNSVGGGSAGIDFVHVNQVVDGGSVRGAIKFWTNRAGTKTYGISLDDNGLAALTGANQMLGAAGTLFKNIRHGVSGAMVLGTVTVTDAGCTASTRYFFSAHTLGTISIPGGYYASTRTASTSFVIQSSQATETSTIDWMAVEP